MGVLVTEYVTIVADADLSSEIDLRSRILRGIAFPEGWEGEDNVGFAIALERNGEFYPVEDVGSASSAEVVFAVEGARLLARTKLIVGGSQTADRVVALLTEPRD